MRIIQEYLCKESGDSGEERGFGMKKKKSSNEQKVFDLFPHNWQKIPHITRQIKEIAGGAQMP